MQLAAKGFFYPFEPVTQGMQLLERSCILFPRRIVVDRKEAGVMTGLEDGARDNGCSRDMDMIGKRQVPQHNSAAAYCAVGPDGCTASYANTSGHGGMGANMDVVPYLYQVVQLDAILNDRVLQSAPVYAGIRADLHIVADTNRAKLLDLFPSPVMGRKTETVRTYHGTRVNNATLSNAATFCKGHPGGKTAVFSNDGIGPYNAVFRDTHSQRKRCACAYAGKCTNRYPGGNAGRRVNKGGSMNGGDRRWCNMLLPELGDTRKVTIWIVNNDACTATCGSLFRRWRDDDTARLACCKFARVFWMTQKGQLTAGSHVQGRQPFNQDLRITYQASIELAGQRIHDGSEFECHASPARQRL